MNLDRDVFFVTDGVRTNSVGGALGLWPEGSSAHDKTFGRTITTDQNTPTQHPPFSVLLCIYTPFFPRYPRSRLPLLSNRTSAFPIRSKISRTSISPQGPPSSSSNPPPGETNHGSHSLMSGRGEKGEDEFEVEEVKDGIGESQGSRLELVARELGLDRTAKRRLSREQILVDIRGCCRGFVIHPDHK